MGKETALRAQPCGLNVGGRSSLKLTVWGVLRPGQAKGLMC